MTDGYGQVSAGAPRRVMVTGGAGFIGSHLTERLLEQGHEVLVVDNFYSSTRSNLRHLLDHPGFELDPEPLHLLTDALGLGDGVARIDEGTQSRFLLRLRTPDGRVVEL
ncbi:NAD-dependent epimerase/dehydratase family protein [Brachybacterium muris]|nr:NAD-dependent epimerase/dehydratase family protein [Brachybacterium muris]